jgi:hypothetical protein
VVEDTPIDFFTWNGLEEFAAARIIGEHKTQITCNADLWSTGIVTPIFKTPIHLMYVLNQTAQTYVEAFSINILLTGMTGARSGTQLNGEGNQYCQRCCPISLIRDSFAPYQVQICLLPVAIICTGGSFLHSNQ